MSKNTYTMSALARLMAGENIAVIHSPRLDTAMFDLQKRHLMLPVWGDMSPALYDLLLTHEISHALHTPIEGWHQALSEHGRAFKGYLNVIEDVRIERLIKAKYPGLVRVFSTAYHELVKRDFFGLDKHKLDPNGLKLIDRINLHAKAGAFFHLMFSVEEQVILDEAYAVETFEDAKALALRLFKRDQSLVRKKRGKTTSFDAAREAYEEALRKLQELREKGAEHIEYDEEEEGDEEGDDEIVVKKVEKTPVKREATTERKEYEDAPRAPITEQERKEEEEMKAMRKALGGAPTKKEDMSEQDKLDQETNEEERFNETSSTDDLRKMESETEALKAAMEAEEKKQELEKGAEEPRAETDDNFREAEESLIDEETRKTHQYGSDEKILILDEMDLSKFVAPASKVNAVITQHAKDHPWDDTGSLAQLTTFLRGEQKVINQLVAEFEMRKNASQYARAGSAKTGQINMKRLHTARLVDDIFQRITKIPEGKSHAMMMFFDQSGSMHNIYDKTLEQMIILVEFCRRMNIPFEVYGFCDSYSSNREFFGEEDYVYPELPTPGKVQLSNGNGHLKQYIYSGMPIGEYKAALLNLWRIRNRHLRPSTEGMNGTPMNKAIALSGQMVEKFKRATKVDVVNVVFLTDGEATDNVSVNSDNYSTTTGTARILFKDRLSPRYKQDSYNRASATAALVSLMGEATGANYIGIFVPDYMRSARSAVNRYHNVTFFGKHKANKFTFERDGFFMTENYGFNSFFIIKPLQRVTGNILADVDTKKSTTQIAKSFSKAAAGRVQNRAFLAVFATQIAETL